MECLICHKQLGLPGDDLARRRLLFDRHHAWSHPNISLVHELELDGLRYTVR